MTLKKGSSGKLLTTTEQQTLLMFSNDDDITQVSSTVTVYSVRPLCMYFAYKAVLYCCVSMEIDDIFDVSNECKDSFEFTKQKFEWTW